MTYKLRDFPLLLLCLISLTGCKLLETNPYEVELHYRNINIDNIPLIEAKCKDKELVRFVWMGDTQRWYDETKDFVRHVNQRNDIDFVMHGGDISDFGMVREFNWVHREMKNLSVPYLALVGNHDILGNGLDVYVRMYGPVNFTFTAGLTKFVCLNTNALEFDYSNPVPDFKFIEQEIISAENEAHQQTIVAMHANPKGEQFNENTENLFQAEIKRLKNLQFCIHAHAHQLMENDFFEDGVMYYGCSSMKNRSYMIFTITADEYDYEVVYF